MKKLIALAAALAVLASFASCTKATTDTPKDTEGTTTTVVTTEGTTEGGSIGDSVIADFRAKATSGEEYTTETLAMALLENEVLDFMGATMPVEPGLLNGFSGEITGFEEGTFFGPMIGAIPFAGYIFRLADGADTAAFIDTLKANADLRWNICTTADEMLTASEGGFVFFLMSPTTFEIEE